MNRRALIGWAAVILLAAGLFALRFPVFIEAYDQFGWQVKCGNGFTTDLDQASNTEKGQPDHTAAAGVTTVVGTNYVAQCNTALLIRRAWAIPAAALGGLMLTWLATAAVAYDRRHPTPHVNTQHSPYRRNPKESALLVERRSDDAH